MSEIDQPGSAPGSGPFDGPKLVIVASILMAAATADGEYDGSEADVIEDLLRQHAGPAQRLSREVRETLVSFDEASFDLSEAVSSLALTDPAHRRLLIQLVYDVVAADKVFHVGEEALFDELTELMGATESEFADLRNTLTAMPAWKD